MLAYEEWFAESYVRQGRLESFWLDDDLRFGWHKHRATRVPVKVAWRKKTGLVLTIR